MADLFCLVFVCFMCFALCWLVLAFILLSSFDRGTDSGCAVGWLVQG